MKPSKRQSQAPEWSWERAPEGRTCVEGEHIFEGQFPMSATKLIAHQETQSHQTTSQDMTSKQSVETRETDMWWPSSFRTRTRGTG